VIQLIDDQGNLTWECQHQGCGHQHQHHLSHEQIQWQGEHLVRLPPCSACGSQTFLRVHFTEEELSALNMWLAWTSERAQTLVDFQAAHQAEQGETPYRAALAYQIKALEAIRDAGGLHTDSHAVALRHQELARQLKASGKVPDQGEGQG
jgi:hypothetical protein